MSKELKLTAAEIKARNTKMAEGGIIFVLVLSLCVYFGIRFAHDDAETLDSAATTVVAPEVAPTQMITVEPADQQPADEATIGGTEPSEVVQSEIGGTTGETPDIQEILPDVPLMVTYSSAEKTFFEGRYRESAAMFATYCDDYPQNAWGHYMHGLALSKAGLNEEATVAFDQALNLKPDHLKSLVNRARAELALDRPDDALISIEQAVALAPSNVDAQRVLGRVYHNLDRTDDAAAAYLEALRLRADDAWTLNNLALIWIEQENFDRAVAPLARATELAPDVAVFHNNLGTALERTGHMTQARDQFELACEQGHDHGEQNFARLDAVTIGADDPSLDLAAIAASWSATADLNDPASLESGTVAAVTLDDDELE